MKATTIGDLDICQCVRDLYHDIISRANKKDKGNDGTWHFAVSFMYTTMLYYFIMASCMSHLQQSPCIPVFAAKRKYALSRQAE